MQTKTIRLLNDLNHSFYQKTAVHFSDSRSYYWQGWNKLVPYIQDASKDKTRISVLDIGAGNGRFGSFLKTQLSDEYFQYIAVDYSQDLLTLAKQRYDDEAYSPTFAQLDILESLLDDSLQKKLQTHKSHIVVLLGVLHHIPSKEFRQKLIKDLADVVIANGYLIFTTWNFMESNKLKQKIIDPNQIDGLEQSDLEKNDVILDWKRGVTAYRYCHYTDQVELDEIITQSGMELTSQFRADGHTGKLNTYTVLQKK